MPLLSITTTDLWVCILCVICQENMKSLLLMFYFHVAGVMECLSSAACFLLNSFDGKQELL